MHENLSNTCCTAVEVLRGRSRFMLINSYFKFSDEIEQHITNLERVLLVVFWSDGRDLCRREY